MTAAPTADHYLRQILQSALGAVDPEKAVLESLEVAGDRVSAGAFHWTRRDNGRVILLGGGKAAGPMARGAEKALAPLAPEGLLVTKYGHGLDLWEVTLLEAGHPLPDENGVAACDRLLQLARSAGEDDLVICLISGGGSALLPAPAEGLTLADKLRATDLLLRAGADIRELNTLRKHLSRIKGGGLAKAVAPAALLTLAISDVIGNRPEVIASGPTVPDPSTFADALAIVTGYGLAAAMPPSVMQHLERGCREPALETWKPPVPPAPESYQIIASIEQAAEAAAAKAGELGYRSEVLTTRLAGEAREAARQLVDRARQRQQALSAGEAPLCLVAGGETTVTVRGNGVGGRNQELALAAAVALEGTTGITLLAAGTDGTDGPTDAAGAVVDGTTLANARQQGLAAEDYLQANDSYHFFARLGDLLMTGPTRTNVMDLTLVLVEPRQER